MFGSSFPGSFNSDVLNAQPTDDESRIRLVEEIKSRAKSCLGVKNYLEAANLYSKGIELSQGTPETQAILYANRSLCHLNMGKTVEAIEDATSAISVDSSYVKGYYRQAMAFLQANQLKAAQQSLARGLQFKPDDKELQAQLEKVEERLKVASSESQSKASQQTNNSNTAATKTTTTNTNNKQSTPSSSQSKQDTHEQAEDEEEELKKANIRGYKKTADGRVTTFFNHDLDEDTKRLIGDIAPKKLEKPIDHDASATEGSAWNSAGTYEEKILTPWAQETLSSLFVSAAKQWNSADIDKAIQEAFSNTASSVMLQVTKVEKVSGDAQWTLFRGRKKHVCDLSVELKWRIDVTASPNFSIEGSAQVYDISADGDYELKIEIVHCDSAPIVLLSALPAKGLLVYRKYVDSSSALPMVVKDILSKFLIELKQK